MAPIPQEQDEDRERDRDDFDDDCPSCGGTGEAPDNGTNLGQCDDCNGTGMIGEG